MTADENRTYHKIVRVREFAKKHAADFAANSLFAQILVGLIAVITEIETLSTTEHTARGSALQGTDLRSHAREVLFDALRAIRRTARVLEDASPGISEKFRIPDNATDNALLNTARAFVTHATPLKAHFIAHELPESFLADLQADIDAFESAISDQSTGVGGHVAASAALDDAFHRGLELVRKLDAIVRNKYAGNPGVLAEWTSASHTERAPRRSKASQPPPATSGQ
jgi:hypothetical protein